MKKLVVIAALVILAGDSFAQDGSDMLYVKTKKLDKSYTGRFAQLDFYNQSSGLNHVRDTVLITVNGVELPFVEHREDDRLNNWFYRQYLQAVDGGSGNAIRMVRCRIDAVTKDSVQVTAYFDFYTQKNALIAGKSIQQQYWFSRGMISEVMIKVDKADM